MRTILAADELPELDEWLAQRARRGGDLYDYEIGGVLRLNPAPRRNHGRWQSLVDRALAPLFAAAGLHSGGPANLGIDGSYVVPDLVVLAAEDEPEGADDVWLGVAAIAVEILSPREDEAAKLADFRAVIGAGHLRLREVWYVDAEAGEVRLYEAATGSRLARSQVVPGADIPGIVFGLSNA